MHRTRGRRYPREDRLHIDWLVSLAGLGVGFVVGLTGTGGGALMTPVMVLLFGIQPLAAVSSDLVAAVVMKPIGGLVHARRGTVEGGIVRWLLVGSVPSAFLGAVLVSGLVRGDAAQAALRTALGAALLLAAFAAVARQLVRIRRGESDEARVEVRPLPTILIGLVGGFVVGMTSVGSGSLIILALGLLYPQLRGSRLVGTDLVQAVPMVGAAALGHILFGEVRIGLTASLLIGSIPGVYLGARLSAVAPDRWLRPAIIVVLMLSAMKLLGVSDGLVGTAAAAGVLAALAAGVGPRLRTGWSIRRRASSPGLP